MWLKRRTSMNSTTSTVPGAADPLEVVAGEVDEHEVLGALLGVGEQLLGEAHVVLGGLAPRPRAGDRMGDGPLARRPCTSASGLLPTIAYGEPSGAGKRNRYMYGLGLTARSTR